MKCLENTGYAVTSKNLAMGDSMQMKLKAGLKVDQISCHTTKVAGFVVEVHVPVGEIERLLRERPDVVELTISGRPLGSPGLEAGGESETLNVLLVRRDRTTEAFASLAQGLMIALKTTGIGLIRDILSLDPLAARECIPRQSLG